MGILEFMAGNPGTTFVLCVTVYCIIDSVVGHICGTKRDIEIGFEGRE